MVEDVVGRAGDDGGVGTLDIGFITVKNIPVNLSLNIRLAPLSLLPAQLRDIRALGLSEPGAPGPGVFRDEDVDDDQTDGEDRQNSSHGYGDQDLQLAGL